MRLSCLGCLGILVVSGLGVLVLIFVLLSRGELYKGLRLHSPSKEYVAESYGIGGGGAAGWFGTFVQINASGEDFVRWSNVVLIIPNAYRVCLRWLDDNRLLVEYPEGAPIQEMHHEMYMEGRAKTVYVTYRATPHGICTGIVTDMDPDGEWTIK